MLGQSNECPFQHFASQTVPPFFPRFCQIFSPSKKGGWKICFLVLVLWGADPPCDFEDSGVPNIAHHLGLENSSSLGTICSLLQYHMVLVFNVFVAFFGGPSFLLRLKMLLFFSSKCLIPTNHKSTKYPRAFKVCSNWEKDICCFSKWKG